MVNKASLMRNISKSTGLSLGDASVCIDAIMDTIGTSISRGERIELRGLGSFSVRKTAARRASFNSGISIPAHGRIVFRPCQKLRESVWNSVNS